MHSVELQSMIAATTNGPAVNNDPSQKVSSTEDILGKESEIISSTSLWDEEE